MYTSLKFLEEEEQIMWFSLDFSVLWKHQKIGEEYHKVFQ